MLEIINVKDYSNGLEDTIKYIHGVWGNDRNYSFYYDAISNSSKQELPQFYIMLKENIIIGCSALITNDFISRHDLYPWIACLYVNKTERGNGYGKLLLEHAETRAEEIGFSKVYLTTDHDGYYEKYGWNRMQDGIDLFSCEATRIYYK